MSLITRIASISICIQLELDLHGRENWNVLNPQNIRNWNANAYRLHNECESKCLKCTSSRILKFLEINFTSGNGKSIWSTFRPSFCEALSHFIFAWKLWSFTSSLMMHLTTIFPNSWHYCMVTALSSVYLFSCFWVRSNIKTTIKN